MAGPARAEPARSRAWRVVAWALLLIGATQPLGHWLRREVVIKWMDRSTGLIFVLFAARLALSRR